ncbi:MAG: [FeFe] hydrogenase H-cluster radical SAM maturase HydE [Alphaproteobacteria bacterium]
MELNKEQITSWLKETDENKLKELFEEADNIRKECVGDEIHLRGLIEFSNCCYRNCLYCGLRAERTETPRYRMTEDEIVECAVEADSYGYGSVVLQSGEDFNVTADMVTSIIKRIKEKTDLAVTLSLGERSYEELNAWRLAGADRYLLRFETSNKELFYKIHPPLKNKKCDRFAILKQLRDLKYEVGSGVMIGIPTQTYESLAEDILKFKELDLDMIGVGPFIPHQDTPLGKGIIPFLDGEEQVPNTEYMAYKVIALTRILCPYTNIPSTTAIATLNKAKGRERGLMSGANVLMPNLTPIKYRKLYEIYPAKACIDETAEECKSCMAMRIKLIGREVGQGKGMSINAEKRWRRE